MLKDATRRRFLRSAPLAAAAAALPPAAAAQATVTPATAAPFKLITAASLSEAAKKLQTTPGNDNLFDSPALPLAVVLTTEEKKAAKEFEWHEGRDHVVQIIAGSTVYEVGGAPENAHNVRAGEWLAPAAKGASKYTLRTGDMLIIPRGTLHKRTTEASVTFILISTPGVVKA